MSLKGVVRVTFDVLVPNTHFSVGASEVLVLKNRVLGLASIAEKLGPFVAGEVKNIHIV